MSNSHSPLEVPRTVTKDTMLIQILTRFVDATINSNNLNKELCLYISFRMLTTEANLAEHKAAKKAFTLHYGDILLEFYQQITYPNISNIDKNRRSYLMSKIIKQIWDTVWKISNDLEVYFLF
jgi:hypothetical protein